MSKMSDWVIELEMDKVHLTREQFAAKHGHMFVYIYDEQLGVVPEVNVEYLKQTKGEY
tara:strand:+ start:611 stop:784 length:174 start_codon:yes stop_codon:yes gene_type:complete